MFLNRSLANGLPEKEYSNKFLFSVERTLFHPLATHYVLSSYILQNHTGLLISIY